MRSPSRRPRIPLRAGPRPSGGPPSSLSAACRQPAQGPPARPPRPPAQFPPPHAAACVTPAATARGIWENWKIRRPAAGTPEGTPATADQKLEAKDARPAIAETENWGEGPACTRGLVAAPTRVDMRDPRRAARNPGPSGEVPTPSTQAWCAASASHLPAAGDAQGPPAPGTRPPASSRRTRRGGTTSAAPVRLKFQKRSMESERALCKTTTSYIWCVSPCLYFAIAHSRIYNL